MPETIESFVAKVREEAVEAGQQEADKLREQARRQAGETLEKTQQEAEKIIENAKAEAEKFKSLGETEFKLAARDTISKLRETLEGILKDLFARTAEQKLSDGKFVARMLKDLIDAYVQADVKGKNIEVNVSEELQQQITDAALQAIGSEARDGQLKVDVAGTLKEAGFEYSISDAKVEVTLSAVVATLTEMVGPKLRELVIQASQDSEPQT